MNEPIKLEPLPDLSSLPPEDAKAVALHLLSIRIKLQTLSGYLDATIKKLHDALEQYTTKKIDPLYFGYVSALSVLALDNIQQKILQLSEEIAASAAPYNPPVPANP